MSLLRFSEFKPIMSFPNGIDLKKFGNKKLERLSGVISLRLKSVVQIPEEAGFPERLLYWQQQQPWRLLKAGRYLMRGSVMTALLALAHVCICI